MRAAREYKRSYDEMGKILLERRGGTIYESYYGHSILLDTGK
jgi:hypothetical protein